MNDFVKRAGACFSAIFLAVVMVTLSVAGAVDTPPIPSGLNYMNLQTGSYQVTTYFNGSGVGLTRASRYNPTTSAFTFDEDLTTAGTTSITFEVNTAGQQVFYYCAGGGMEYYASANLRVYDQNGNAYRYHANVVTFYSGGNRVWSGAGPYGALIPSRDVVIDRIDFVFDVGGNPPPNVESWRLENLLFTQGTPIYNNYIPESYFDEQMTSYVPFNSAWFEPYENWGSTTYAEGYEDGYAQGALDTGGDVYQNWTAFLTAGVGGFLSFELIPGLPLWGLLSIMVAIPLMVTFLKMFAGG